MCSDAALYWIEILSVNHVTPARWFELSGRIPARQIVSMLRSMPGRDQLGRMTGRKVDPPDRKLIDTGLSFIERERCGALCIEDALYPPLLASISKPPPLLWYNGDPSLLTRPSVCIVGSRRAGRRGIVVARDIAFELAGSRFLVISGMARGIDTAAHEGALAAEGFTAAVLGCGIDVPYPPENASLAVDIAASGCLISEFSPGTPPLHYHFPMRNRVMSGLSAGVVVVEAGLESGAMGTARWAADQGREVFAVPGPVDSPGSRGPHRLIREGACLVESAGDIRDELASSWKLPGIRDALSSPACDKSSNLNGDEQLTGEEMKVISQLDLDPKHVDELVQICHISATSILPVLLGLEMKGMAESCGGGRYSIASSLKKESGFGRPLHFRKKSR